MNVDTTIKSIHIFNNAKTLFDVAEALNVYDFRNAGDDSSLEWWEAYYSSVSRIGAVDVNGGEEYWVAQRNDNGSIWCITIEDDGVFHIVEFDDDNVPEVIFKALKI